MSQSTTPSPEIPFAPLLGGCRCGAVRLRMDAAPIITHCCHCRFCQKVSGAPFRVNAMIETEHLVVTQGEPEPFQGAGSTPQRRCAACGFAVWFHHPDLGPGIAFVGVGVFDEGERLAPEAHYFTRSKHPWVALPPGVVAFETLGDPGKPGARERIFAAVAASGRSLVGWTGDAPPQ